jgi:hypothetical protein
MNIMYVGASFWLTMPTSAIHKKDDNYYVSTQYYFIFITLVSHPSVSCQICTRQWLEYEGRTILSLKYAACRGASRFLTLPGPRLMASAGARAYWGSGGVSPQWGPGAKPLVRGSGGRSPLEVDAFLLIKTKILHHKIE